MSNPDAKRPPSRWLLGLAGAALLAQAPWSSASAKDPEFSVATLIPRLRDMVGKSLLPEAIDFSNKSSFTLEAITAEGARLFLGGSPKVPGDSADNLRVTKPWVIIVATCRGARDLSARIASVSAWQTFDDERRLSDAPHIALGLEEMLALMNTPPGIVTPSTLRSSRVPTLHGPVFEYVRGDTTETLGFVNEGSSLRINWTSTNNAVCPS